jgi:hypothetical protein
MGLLACRWRFDGAPPDLAALCAELERRTGVAARHGRPELLAASPDDAGEGRREWSAAALELPGVCRGFELFVMRSGDVVEVESGIPAHPYLSLQVDAALQALGGRRPDGARSLWGLAWPAPLSVPWRQLPWALRMRYGRAWLWPLWRIVPLDRTPATP